MDTKLAARCTRLDFGGESRLAKFLERFLYGRGTTVLAQFDDSIYMLMMLGVMIGLLFGQTSELGILVWGMSAKILLADALANKIVLFVNNRKS